MHKAEIELSVHAGDSHIKIDGREIEGVTKVVVSQAAGEVPQITLDLLIDSFHIAAEGELHRRRQSPTPRMFALKQWFGNRPKGWNPYDGCHE